jgi:hypothetical protein
MYFIVEPDNDRGRSQDPGSWRQQQRAGPGARACCRRGACGSAPSSGGVVVVSRGSGSQPGLPTWRRRIPPSQGHLSLCRHWAPPGARPPAIHRIGDPAGPCAEILRPWSGGCSRTAHRSAGLRQRGCCGPCGDGRTGSRDPHGCASAGGTRAPCDGDGCSAGTYACSRISPRAACWNVTRDLSRPGRTTQDAARKPAAHSGLCSWHNWHRLPAQQTPPEVRSWTCGTGRTGFDLPTVRGACSQGQFVSLPRAARTTKETMMYLDVTGLAPTRR